MPLLILAGGLATRLKGLAKDTPKYLQPIDEKKVFADIHLRWAAHHGFKRVFLSVGHMGEKIEAYCGSGSKYGLELSYLFDGDKPLGTGGAVRGALKYSFDAVAITYGDTLLSVPVAEFLATFESSGLDGAMSVYRNKVPGHTCNADLRAGNLVTYDKKSPAPDWAYIDYGFLALKRSAIDAASDPLPFDLAAPLSRLSRADQIQGFEVKERFWEIGSPEALEEFRTTFRDDIAKLYDN
jgi:NDP-sugar pyrophosphorylase family protein